MWLASAFLHVTSAASTSAASPSSLSFLSHALVPRAFIVGTCRSRRPARSQQDTAAVAVLARSRRFLADVACKSSSRATAGAGSGEGNMVPEDAASLLRSVYTAKPTPQVCLASTGSGGQALAWLLGIPGASSCLLEMTVPYSTEAFDEKLAAGPPPSGYVSREAAEGLARDAYTRAVALCVAGSDRGPRALLDKRIVGVGSTAAVVSSRIKTGLHRCFVCAQTAEGFAHYELNLAKGRRDRNGEDNAVSRVLIQAIAEAVGVIVPSAFKSDHLLLDTRGQADGGCFGTGNDSGGSDADDAGDGQERLSGGGGEGPAEGGEEVTGEGGEAAERGRGASAAVEGTGGATEVVPVADISPEFDAIEELVSGRSSAALIVPREPLPGHSASASPSASFSAGNGEATCNSDSKGNTDVNNVGKNDSSSSSGSSSSGKKGTSEEIAQEQTLPPPEAAPAGVVLQGSAVKAALPRGTTVILPGSFNPLHRGHLGLLEAARQLFSEKLQSEAATHQHGYQTGEGGVGDGGNGRRLLGKATTTTPPEGEVPAVHAVFELSVANPDKGGLAAEEIRRRARQFGEAGGVGWPGLLLISRAPLFSQKARLFPGCAFVVGADTAKRVVDPKYYGNSQVEMVTALAEIRHLGCSFIVGGREDDDGCFLTLDGVLERSGLPESLRAMFHGLHESAFRENLSSTSIRASAGKAAP